MGLPPAGSIPSADAGQQEELDVPDWGDDQEMPGRTPTPPEETKAEEEGKNKSEEDVYTGAQAVPGLGPQVSGVTPASQGAEAEVKTEP